MNMNLGESPKVLASLFISFLHFGFSNTHATFLSAWGLGMDRLVALLLYWHGSLLLDQNRTCLLPSLPFFLNTGELCLNNEHQDSPNSYFHACFVRCSYIILVFMLIRIRHNFGSSSLDDSSGLAEYLVTFATPMLAFLITLCIASDGCTCAAVSCISSCSAPCESFPGFDNGAHSHLSKNF